MSKAQSMLEAALEYAARGWPVFPCAPRDKVPATKHGVKDATLDRDVIRDWWEAEPDANIGLACGIAFVALDVDGEEGMESLRAMRNGTDCVPRTPMSRTGGNGWHLLFAVPQEVFGNRAGVRPGVDTRGAGGYIVAPPSIHRSGHPYVWQFGPQTPLADCPEWLLDAVRKTARTTQPLRALAPADERRRRWAAVALDEELHRVGTASEGTRNDTLNAAAFALGQLVAGGALHRERVERELMAAAEVAGLGKAEAGFTIASGLEAGMRKPREPAGRVRSTTSASGTETQARSYAEKSRVSYLAPPWQPFPIHALPPVCRQFVYEHAKAAGVDSAYVAVPLLGALAGAIGNSRVLDVKRSYFEPAVLWVAVVAPSGAMKSPHIQEVLRPHRKRDQSLLDETHQAFEKYERELLAYEVTRAEYKQARRSGEEATEPVKPISPPRRAALAEDITVEALAERLADNPRGLLLGLDELAGWVRSFDAYKRARGADVNKYLAMHGARPLKVDRKARDQATIYCPRAALSIVGTIQPGILARVMGVENRENGLLARLLLAMPPLAFAPWTERDVSVGVLESYQAVVDALLDLEPEMIPEPEPIPLKLTAGARSLWVEYHDRIMTRAAIADEDLMAALSKLRGGALRIALVLGLARAAQDHSAADLTEVDELAMSGGITVAEWFANEAERVYVALALLPEERGQAQLAAVVSHHGGRITPADLARSSLRRYRRNSERAEAALGDLVKAGLGEWENVGPGPRGGRPTRVFVLGAKGPGALLDTVPLESGPQPGGSVSDPPEESAVDGDVQGFVEGLGAAP